MDELPFVTTVQLQLTTYANNTLHQIFLDVVFLGQVIVCNM